MINKIKNLIEHFLYKKTTTEIRAPFSFELSTSDGKILDTVNISGVRITTLKNRFIPKDAKSDMWFDADSIRINYKTVFMGEFKDDHP